MNRILLAYCRENAALAAEIDRQLSRIGIPFEHLSDQDGQEPGYIARTLVNTPEPALLLVTDNFLKNTACMSGMLPALQNMIRDRRVLAVVADGRRTDEQGNYVAVPTHFDRMVYALQYMNHWQSIWLEMSDRHSHAEGAAKEAMLETLNTTRNIANEMGDLISALRESGFIEYPEFINHDFAAFFQRFGLQHWHEQYRHIAAQDAAAEPAESELASPEPEPAAVELSGHASLSNGIDLPPAATTAPEPPAFDKIDELLQHMEAEAAAEQEQMPPAEEAALPIPEMPAVTPEAPEIVPDTISPPDFDAEAAETSVSQHIDDALFWLENGHTERGLDLLDAALELYPDHPRLQETREAARAKYEQTVVLAASPALPVAEAAQTVMPQLMNSEARSYELMGDMALQKGDYLFAKYCWDRTAELEPAYPGIYRKLGTMVTEHLREYRETGLQYLKHALSQDPNDAAVHLALAKVALQNNEPEAAEVYYLSAVAADAALKTAENDLLFLPQIKAEAPEMEATVAPQIEPEASLPEFPSADVMPDANLSDVGTAFEAPETPELPAFVAGNAIETPLPEEDLLVLPESTAAATSDQDEISDLPAAPREEEVEGHPAPDGTAHIVALEQEEMSPAAVTPAATPDVPAPEPDREILTILITGATSGIGRATAEIFARHGHRLILTGRRVDRLADMKRYFESELQADVLMLPFDVRDNGAVHAALDNLPEAWQTVDVLINNAGLAKGLSPIQEGELDHWETMIDTNIKGLLYVTRVVAPGMVRRRRGHIVNIGSIAGKEIYPNGNVYCASKAAVDALTRAMRMDLYAHNIRVSQVSPGHVEETEFALNRFDGDAARGAKVYENFQPLRAGDVAEVIYFMVTRPPHVNIQDVVLYGTQQASATLIDRSGR